MFAWSILAPSSDTNKEIIWMFFFSTAINQDETSAQTIYDEGNTNLSEVNSDGNTAVLIAAEYGNFLTC